jgi:hypothetical protein
MSYVEYHLGLSDLQKTKLVRAVKNGEGISLKLDNSQLTGNDKILLTKRQVNKIEKAKSKGIGVVVAFSKQQLHKNRALQGGFLQALLPIMKGLAGPLLGSLLTPISSAIGNRVGRAIQGNGIKKKHNPLAPVSNNEQVRAQIQAPQDTLQHGQITQEAIDGGFLPLLAMAAAPLIGNVLGSLFRGQGLTPMGQGLIPMGMAQGMRGRGKKKNLM